MNEFFAQVRRAGFDIGVSTAKLTQAMVEVLSQLPPDALLSKVVVVRHLGLLVRMSDDQWDAVLSTNLTGEANTFQNVFPDAFLR